MHRGFFHEEGHTFKFQRSSGRLHHDRHGRNLGYLTKSGGVRILSPFYDNPSYLGIADELMLGSDIQPKGTILTKESEEPTTKHYIEEFKRLELEAAVDSAKAKFNSKRTFIFQTINRFQFLSEKRKSALIRLIESRMGELEND